MWGIPILLLLTVAICSSMPDPDMYDDDIRYRKYAQPIKVNSGPIDYGFSKNPPKKWIPSRDDDDIFNYDERVKDLFHEGETRGTQAIQNDDKVRFQDY